MSKSRNYCFTLNNYSENDLTLLSVLPPNSSYLIYGKEVGESGTAHLQGFISFKHPVRFSHLKKLLPAAHIESAKNPSNAIEYCKKDGDFYELGVPPKFRAGQGKRSDLRSLVDAVKQGETDRKKLREEHPEVCAKYPQFVQEILLDQLPPIVPENFDLLSWQKNIGEVLNNEPDPREIIFIVDPDGNNGKSWFIKSYSHWHPGECIKLTPGKKADTVYAFLSQLTAKSRVVFFDAPRSKQKEFIQYDLLEEIKNGLVFNSKYQSRIVEFQRLHVVVMLNEEPDKEKLSYDRYNINEIS